MRKHLTNIRTIRQDISVKYKYMERKKVFVALSGGVDSSVSAALLKKEGYDVTGVFIKVWHPDFLPCEWKTERRDAMRVCVKLNIPFMTFDFESEYKKDVVDYMVREYKAGKTPNPDVMCNRHIKFGAFLRKVRESGVNFIATGHYARSTFDEKTGTYKLLRGIDRNKDQTYFLWMLTQDDLKSTIFPVGDMEKKDVRKKASEFGLETADKKDSQGLCFVGKIDLRDFLKHFIDSKEGDVINEKGEKIGTHEGAFFYTLGQRHGFITDKKTPSEAPLYVVDRNVEDNTITVSSTPTESEHNKKEILLKDVNWISTTPKEGKTLRAQYRYRQKQVRCIVRTGVDEVKIEFETKQASVASGQSLVIYDGDECLGGGVIL